MAVTLEMYYNAIVYVLNVLVSVLLIVAVARRAISGANLMRANRRRKKTSQLPIASILSLINFTIMYLPLTLSTILVSCNISTLGKPYSDLMQLLCRVSIIGKSFPTSFLKGEAFEF